MDSSWIDLRMKMLDMPYYDYKTQSDKEESEKSEVIEVSTPEQANAFMKRFKKRE